MESNQKQLLFNTATTLMLIPAHNEQTTVGEIVRAVKQATRCHIVVIDDASTDDTVAAASAAGALVLPLALKLGAWGAIQTGIRYALSNGYRTVVSIDADGQHDAAYISALLKPITTQQADVVIGACPPRVSHARRIAWSYFRLLSGVRLEDITSGFRAYNYVAMQTLAAPEASLLDYQDIGVLMILRRKGLRIREVPVKMSPRTTGISRVFSSWLIVAQYMLQTSLLCIARIGMNGTKPESAANKITP